MMRQQTNSAARFEIERQRDVQTASRSRFFVLTAVLMSVGVHLLAVLMVVFLPRVLPNEAKPREQGVVELLMVEKKGAEPAQESQPHDKQPSPSQQAETPKAQPQKDESPALGGKARPAQLVADGDEPPPPEQAQPKASRMDRQPAPRQASVPPMPSQSQEAPVFNLAGTESETDAIVMDERVLPAMRDDRFRNRPPIYPAEAQMHGQNGSVVVVIHVSENGMATGADILESSGYQVLDMAAVTAVRKWHFRPALKEGRAVPFDMPFRFTFEPY